MTDTNDAFTRQVGGNHYNKLPIQPFTYSMENALDPMQHTIIKYVTRFRDKGGIADLEKAKHVIDMLIEWETRPQKPLTAKPAGDTHGRRLQLQRTEAPDPEPQAGQVQ